LSSDACIHSSTCRGCPISSRASRRGRHGRRKGSVRLTRTQVVIARSAATRRSRCCKRPRLPSGDCHASLAMTVRVKPGTRALGEARATGGGPRSGPGVSAGAGDSDALDAWVAAGRSGGAAAALMVSLLGGNNYAWFRSPVADGSAGGDPDAGNLIRLGCRAGPVGHCCYDALGRRVLVGQAGPNTKRPGSRGRRHAPTGAAGSSDTRLHLPVR